MGKRKLSISRNSIIIVAGIIVMVLLLLWYWNYRESNKKLSDMTVDECIQFMEDMNVEIPEEFQDKDIRAIAEDVLEKMKWLEEYNLEVPVGVSYTVLADFYEDIRHAMREYYGLESN